MLALRFLFTHMRLKAQTKKYPKLLKIYSAPNLPPIPNIILLPCIKKVSDYRMFLGSLAFYFHYYHNKRKFATIAPLFSISRML